MLPLLLAKVTSRIILNALTIRVHTGIAGYTWSRLWYLCRAFDIVGTGYVELDIEAVQSFLNCSQATVYRLLAEGKQNKAFRFYRLRANTLQIGLGSLFKVCNSLGLNSWGAVAKVLLIEILDLSGLRSTATAINTQKFQQQSRYAANSKLKPDYRRNFGAPYPHELLQEVIKGSDSHKTEAGKLPPFVLHISKSRIFVSGNFVHFGASQQKIAFEQGRHKRTIRRHQRAAGLRGKQICQKRETYMWVVKAWENEAPEYYHNKAQLKACGTGSDSKFRIIGYTQTDDIVRFTDGTNLGSKSKSPNRFNIPASEFGNRFFQMGNDFWINRCNIYEELHDLTTMRASKRKYRKMLTRQGIEAKLPDSTNKQSEVDSSSG